VKRQAPRDVAVAFATQIRANDPKDPSHFNIKRHLINHENRAIENFMTRKVQQMAAENGFFYSLNKLYKGPFNRPIDVPATKTQ
jgi:hypothetical protein